MKQIFLTLALTTATLALGHGGEKHDEAKTRPSEKGTHEDSLDFMPAPNSNKEEALKEVSTAYLSQVEPIFKKSCFDCHSSKTNYPWYHILPGIRQLIDSDIKEAKSHLDFSDGFPFISHESPLNDLLSIGEAIKEESMPPFKYRVLHPSSALSDQQKKTVLDWIENSREKLK